MCQSEFHNPPKTMMIAPGRHSYTCPECGKVTEFTVTPFIPYDCQSWGDDEDDGND